MTFADREPEPDVSPAAWVVAGVRPFRANLITSLVPAGFAAYARVFHPAHAEDGSPVRWAAVAAANGRVAHPAMEWVGITGDWRYVHEMAQPGLWDRSPDEGSLPSAEASALGTVLRRYSPSERWWFGLWDGFGASPHRWSAAPRVPMPARSMFLFRGGPGDQESSFNESQFWHQSANLWWPDDHAWCVATDIDLMTTYVGGSDDVIAAILAHPELETARVPPDQTLAYDTDTINPPPAARP